MTSKAADLPWLMPGMPFPLAQCAWPAHSDAPGLLAAGGDLSPETLRRAYSNGVFPWFSEGQPILWWSPEPRMVLQTRDFKLQRSLQKTLRRFVLEPGCSLRFDTVFERVIKACAQTPRDGQPGTWIVPEMINAYTNLHRAGHAHSVETWVDGELVGGWCLRMVCCVVMC